MDIFILLTQQLHLHKERVFLDNGKSDARQLIPLITIDLPNEHRTAILWFHAITGNNHVLSFLE